MRMTTELGTKLSALIVECKVCTLECTKVNTCLPSASLILESLRYENDNGDGTTNNNSLNYRIQMLYVGMY